MTFSAQYTSTDNASIERSQRTIFETAHAMLLHAGLATTFWNYALAHAVYIYNRMPTNTEQGQIAPITAAFRIIADLSNKHTFGCRCYGIIPAETREKGFTDKSYKGIYLGHRPNGSPGYCVLNIETNKVALSSHVNFDETDLDEGSQSRYDRCR